MITICFRSMCLPVFIRCRREAGISSAWSLFQGSASTSHSNPKMMVRAYTSASFDRISQPFAGTLSQSFTTIDDSGGEKHTVPRVGFASKKGTLSGSMWPAQSPPISAPAAGCPATWSWPVLYPSEGKLLTGRGLSNFCSLSYTTRLKPPEWEHKG